MKHFLLVLLSALLAFAVVARADETDVTDDDEAASDLPELKIEVLHMPEECEKKSEKGNTLSMHYKGTLEDGTQFDSSYDRDEPFTFQVGAGRVIQGWDQGLLDMCVGEKRRLIIPPHLGYGDQGAGDKIPGGSTLYFETELLSFGEAPPPVNIFKEIDVDADRKLSREEIEQFIEKKMGEAPPAIHIEGMEEAEAAEAEKREKVKEQREKLLTQIFEHEDVDKDGFISHDEFRGPKDDPRDEL